MSFADRFSFRQKPEGLFKWILHLPVFLFRWHLGFLIGERFILITHVGRKSGRTYQTPPEVVEHDTESGEFIVSSGTGPGADWYRNIVANPVQEVQVKNDSWKPFSAYSTPRKPPSGSSVTRNSIPRPQRGSSSRWATATTAPTRVGSR